jgi:hypothetical protein
MLNWYMMDVPDLELKGYIIKDWVLSLPAKSCILLHQETHKEIGLERETEF